MKNFFVKAILSVLLTLPFTTGPPAGAFTTSQLNVTGNYVVNFVSGGLYFHDMNLVQDVNGNISGSGGFPAQGPYAYSWHITSGTIVGDQLNLTIMYDTGAPGAIMHMTGTVAAEGTMSGNWDNNYLEGHGDGTWLTTVGAAALLSAEDFGVVNYDTGLGG